MCSRTLHVQKCINNVVSDLVGAAVNKQDHIAEQLLLLGNLCKKNITGSDGIVGTQDGPGPLDLLHTAK